VDGVGGGCGTIVGGGGGGGKPTASLPDDPGRGRAPGGGGGAGLGGVGGWGCWMGIVPTGDPLCVEAPVITGPLMTGPPESPELPEETEIMDGAVEIFLWRVAGEAGIVHVSSISLVVSGRMAGWETSVDRSFKMACSLSRSTSMPVPTS
jgi:hypothetical protein